MSRRSLSGFRGQRVEALKQSLEKERDRCVREEMAAVLEVAEQNQELRTLGYDPRNCTAPISAESDYRITPRFLASHFFHILRIGGISCPVSFLRHRSACDRSKGSRSSR